MNGAVSRARLGINRRPRFWILFRPGLGYYCADGEAWKAAVFLRSDFHREIKSISLQQTVRNKPCAAGKARVECRPRLMGSLVIGCACRIAALVARPRGGLDKRRAFPGLRRRVAKSYRRYARRDPRRRARLQARVRHDVVTPKSPGATRRITEAFLVTRRAPPVRRRWGPAVALPLLLVPV